MIEIWGGIECTVNRVGDRWFDQIRRSGHDGRIDDLDRIASLGVRALRYPVLWERHAPESLDAIDWSWSDARLERLRQLRIRPIVGLVHHGSGPRYTSLVDPQFPSLLARYASAVAARYPWISDYTPINEPLTTARFAALYGHWYPHTRDLSAFVRALLNQLEGVRLAMRAIRAINPEARLVQTEDCGRTTGTAALRDQVEHEQQRRWLTFDVLAGSVDRGHPLFPLLSQRGANDRLLGSFVENPCGVDVIGLNYYLTSDRFLDDRVQRYPPHLEGGNGRQSYVDMERVRTCADGIDGHLRHLAEAWHRYRRPVAITEVHAGCTREEQIRWLREAWRAAHVARGAGIDVQAVTPWALLGSFDWDSLVTDDAGHYEPGAFDVSAGEPRATALASAIREMAGGNTPSHVAANGLGWWRRLERLAYGPSVVERRAPPAGPPLLVVGSTGTLGRALQRVCSTRGLRSAGASRHDADIGDPLAVDGLLRRLRPWAVVNAAGYVRVDDAEQDRAACWHANVAGAVSLAAACRRHSIPFVTFSSDLVFDGEADRPYTEHDSPSPLNVYGESKLEAERRVLEVLPEALVIRTSAFFGPWDSYNYLTFAMRDLQDRGEFLAPHDTVVSPTYVPHLAHAVLDLLIDGERGIWHLANGGAVSWYDFACRAARECGWEEERIKPVETSAVWSPAARPRYSALDSVRGRLMPALSAGVAEWSASWLARQREVAAAGVPLM